MPMSQGLEDVSFGKINSGGSSLLIFRTSFVLSICGLQPPQYFMPINFICIHYLITNMVSLDFISRLKSIPDNNFSG
jgi:hypothetical protein